MKDDSFSMASEQFLGPIGRRLQFASGAVGIAGLVLCAVSMLWNRSGAVQSYLFAYLYWFSFTIGCLGMLLMNNVVGGRWGIVTRRFSEAGIKTLLPMIVLFIPILLGMKDLYSWTNGAVVQHDSILQHRAGYLNTPFFIIRTVIYFLVWVWLGYTLNRYSKKLEQTGEQTWIDRMTRVSAPGLLLFTFLGSFAFIDWIMSIDPHWYSTVYAANILVGQVLQGFALVIIGIVLVSRKIPMEEYVTPQLLLDLGNMTFAFIILWAYHSLSQLIIVWPGNLPAEITWYLDRTRGGWNYFAIAIALLLFTLPFLLLLSRTRKKNPSGILRIAIIIVIAKAIDLFWTVEPSFRPQGAAVYWSDLFAFVGIGGIWLFVYLANLRGRSILPLHDPRLAPKPQEATA